MEECSGLNVLQQKCHVHQQILLESGHISLLAHIVNTTSIFVSWGCVFLGGIPFGLFDRVDK